MARQCKRRRVAREQSDDTEPEELKASYSVATDEDRRDWAGWVEVESEPAIFNAMLEKMGVRGVRVQEIVSLDEEMLAAVPRPAFGLIFLYKWLESPTGTADDSEADEVWFANQTSGNACGTIALLNIINNADGIELGEHLQQFNEFCRGLSPAQRGHAITHNAFLRRIHNMHARRMDMLATDLYHKQQATEPKKRAVSRRIKTRKIEDESAFHFVAYIPKNGVVWCLDGLEKRPRLLQDTSADDWLLQVKLELESRMQIGISEGQLQFCILCLVRDPLEDLEEQLHVFMQGNADAKSASKTSETDGEAHGCQDAAAATRDNDCASTKASAIAYQESQLRASISDIKAGRQQEERILHGRQHDYAPAISTILKLHVNKKLLSTLLTTGA